MFNLFTSILKSYIFPKSKTRKFRELVYIYIPNLTKIAVIFILIATLLVWMGINNGLQEEFQRFKKDPYTTSIFVPSQRFSFAEEQLKRIKNVRYHEQDRFNFADKGNLIFESSYPFASVYLVFFAKDGIERKIFRGRTLAKADQSALTAIKAYLSTKKQKDYDLPKDWHDNEKGIIVSKYLLERLGYDTDVDTVSINYSFEPIGQEYLEDSQDAPSQLIPISLKVLAVADKMPFGDFIISNGFYYNYQVVKAFNPFDRVEQFRILTPPGKQQDIETFLEKKFKFTDRIVKIDEKRTDKKLMYRIDFLDRYSLEKKEYEEFDNETSKHSILEKIKNTPFQCADDFYQWEEWQEGKGNISPDYLTLYLKEQFVDLLPQLNVFLNEIGIEMDDSIVNIFKNYYKDIAHFKRISFILYVLLVALGILVSVVIYIKSVQASMHRLGVFSTFGVSSKFLGAVLAVESVFIFIASLFLALVISLIIPLQSLGIAVKFAAGDILKILFIGSALSFISVFFTAKTILKKPPYSLISYRG